MLSKETKCLVAALLAVALGMAMSMKVERDTAAPVSVPLYHNADLNLSVWVTSQDAPSIQQADSGNAVTGTMSATETVLDGGLGEFFPQAGNNTTNANQDGRLMLDRPDVLGNGFQSLDRGFDSRVSWD